MQRRSNKCEKLKRDEFSLYVLHILQVSITMIVTSFSQSLAVAHCLINCFKNTLISGSVSVASWSSASCRFSAPPFPRTSLARSQAI